MGRAPIPIRSRPAVEHARTIAMGAWLTPMEMAFVTPVGTRLQDESACNYDATATDPGACFYPDQASIATGRPCVTKT